MESWEVRWEMPLTNHMSPWSSTQDNIFFPRGTLIQNPFFFFLNFWLCCVACRILVPGPGIKTAPSAVEAQSRSCWTTRESPASIYFWFKSMSHSLASLESTYQDWFLPPYLLAVWLWASCLYCTGQKSFTYFSGCWRINQMIHAELNMCCLT